MVGNLSDQVECPPVIKAYLCQWQNLHTVLWASKGRDCSVIQDKHYSILCPNNVNTFRLFVHTPTNAGQEYDIMEYNGTKSRYSKGMSTRCQSANVQCNRSGILCSSGGKVFENKKTDLEHAIREIEEKKNEKRKIYDDKKEELSRVKDDTQSERNRRSQCQAIFAEIESKKNTVASETRKIAELNRTLSSNASEEKKKKLRTYEEAMRRQMSHVSSVLSCVEMYNKEKIAEAARGILRAKIRECLQEAEDKFKEASEGLAAHRTRREDAERDRSVIASFDLVAVLR